MKKIFLHAAVMSGALCLISWGSKGHRAIASIAQKHLTSNTAYVVSAILSGQAMSEVATWADENRNPRTGAWHYLNLPPALSHEAFISAVSQSDNNIYTAILKTEARLKDRNLSVEERNKALKYLIHLVGDAHQPMHVSRKEDKGGNAIQLRFDHRGTNLHSLWDSKLIDHEGLSEQDIVKIYDLATISQIKQWQADSPMEWLWESYQISSELYALAKPGQTIDEEYYQKYIQVTRKRIEQAGIRLAGELNKLFNSSSLPATSTAPAPAVFSAMKLTDVKRAIGKTVIVSGKVFSLNDIGSMILVNIGAAYPKQLLTVALKGKAKELSVQIQGKTISVTGEVIDYQGKPEIIVSEPTNIKF